MSEDDEEFRVRFYGRNDLASGLHADRVAKLASEFDPERTPSNVTDILELHNVQKYLELGLLPNSCSDEERDQLVALVPHLRTAVARYFSAVDSSNFVQTVAGVDHEFHEDLIELLGRSKVFHRCASDVALPALKAAGVYLSEMLGNRDLVNAYEQEMRNELLSADRGAELLVWKYLQKEPRGAIHLPKNFTPDDARRVFENYIQSDVANLNYVRLIANSSDHAQAGIDAKLKLKAKRRSVELNAEIFETNEVVKSEIQVYIADDQSEPSALTIDSSDGLVRKYTYGRKWLESTLDFPSILSNFQYLFEFADQQVLLTLPSYPAGLGVFARTMGLTGNKEYKVGRASRNADTLSLLQTTMYRNFLRSHEIEIEDVIAWFFESYLITEFGVSNFTFEPSNREGSYLQRVRHLFAEMESVANQFALFAENGELDRELLTMGADAVRYKAISSLLEGKYLYPSDAEEITRTLHLLFSDQSRLTYIRKGLQGASAVQLLLENEVLYEDLHYYQKVSVDYLIGLGVLENTGSRVQLANLEQTLVLRSLFSSEAASYFHQSEAGRAQADAMVASGWLIRRSSLLTEAEADYFNYFLNRVGFSNGPNLRNRYQHGSQAGAGDENAHFRSYLIALRLVVALVIKINDDLSLSSEERTREGNPG